MSSVPVRFLPNWSRTACVTTTPRCATLPIDKRTAASVLSISNSPRFFRASKNLPMDRPNSESVWSRLQWWAATDRGKIRPNNEDSLMGLQLDAREVHYLGRHAESSTEPIDLIFACSDGMCAATAEELPSATTTDPHTNLLP